MCATQLLLTVARKGFTSIRVTLFNPRSTESHRGLYLLREEGKVSSMTNRIIAEQTAGLRGARRDYQVTRFHPWLSWKK